MSSYGFSFRRFEVAASERFPSDSETDEWIAVFSRYARTRRPFTLLEFEYAKSCGSYAPADPTVGPISEEYDLLVLG